MVALGVDLEGKKLPLGFWEGATENHEICEELLEGLERRGLKLSKRVLWVTDGGGGIIKALKDRYGKKLIHQRCTLHKDRNIQRHLPKRYRKQAHHLFATALEQNSYKDAKKMLQEFERWLRDINESAADSLVESLEEVLMLHKLKVPALLRKSLHSTNPIESMFSMVRSCERNIKRYRSSKMRQRWLAAVLEDPAGGFGLHEPLRTQDREDVGARDGVHALGAERPNRSRERRKPLLAVFFVSKGRRVPYQEVPPPLRSY